MEFLIFVSQPDVIRILQKLAMYQMTVEFMWNSLKISIRIPVWKAQLATDILIRIFDDHGILEEFRFQAAYFAY